MPAIPTKTLGWSEAEIVWQVSDPFMTFTPDVQSEVQYVSDTFNQKTYVIWYSQQKLYTNYQLLNGTWGAPIFASVDPTNASLKSNSMGNIIIIWETIETQDTIYAAEISVGLSDEL